MFLHKACVRTLTQPFRNYLTQALCKEGLLHKPSVIMLYQAFVSVLQKSSIILQKLSSSQTQKTKTVDKAFYITLLKEGVRCKHFLVMSYFSLIFLFNDTGTKRG